MLRSIISQYGPRLLLGLYYLFWQFSLQLSVKKLFGRMGPAGLGLHSRAVGVQAWRGFTVLQVYFWLRTCVVHVNAVGVIIISNNDIIMLSCELS
jgi:hypothetical protein